MIDGKARSASVTSVGSMATIVVPHHVFEKLVNDEPAFAHGLLLLCARLREAESR